MLQSASSLTHSFWTLPELFKYELFIKRQKLLLLNDNDSKSVETQQKERIEELDSFLETLLEDFYKSTFQISITKSFSADLDVLADTIKYIGKTSSKSLFLALNETLMLIEVVKVGFNFHLVSAEKKSVKEAVEKILDIYSWQAFEVNTLLSDTKLEKLLNHNSELDGLIFQAVGNVINAKISDWKQCLAFFLSCNADPLFRPYFLSSFNEWFSKLRRESKLSNDFLLEFFEQMPSFFEIDAQGTLECFNQLFVNYRDSIMNNQELFESMLNFLTSLGPKADGIISNIAARLNMIVKQPAFQRSDTFNRIISFIYRFKVLKLQPVNHLIDHVLDSADFTKFPSLLEDFCRLLCLRVRMEKLSFSCSIFKDILGKFSAYYEGVERAIGIIVSEFEKSDAIEWQELLAYKVSEQMHHSILDLALDSFVSRSLHPNADFLQTLLNNYYPAEIEKFKNALDTKSSGKLAKMIVILLDFNKLSIADFLSVFGPNTVLKTGKVLASRDRALICSLYENILSLHHESCKILRINMPPERAPEFWLKCLLDPDDYEQLEIFNLLSGNNYSLLEAIQVLRPPSTLIAKYIKENTDDWSEKHSEFMICLMQKLDRTVIQALCRDIASRFNLQSFELVLQFYALAYNSGDASERFNFIRSNLNRNSSRELISALKCFNCSWTCLTAIFQELMDIDCCPIDTLVRIFKFYLIKNEFEALEAIKPAVLSTSVSLTQRALIVLLAADLNEMPVWLLQFVKNHLQKLNLGTLIPRKDELDYDFDYDFDLIPDDENINFQGADFHSFLEQFQIKESWIPANVGIDIYCLALALNNSILDQRVLLRLKYEKNYESLRQAVLIFTDTLINHS